MRMNDRKKKQKKYWRTNRKRRRSKDVAEDKRNRPFAVCVAFSIRPFIHSIHFFSFAITDTHTHITLVLLTFYKNSFRKRRKKKKIQFYCTFFSLLSCHWRHIVVASCLLLILLVVVAFLCWISSHIWTEKDEVEDREKEKEWVQWLSIFLYVDMCYGEWVSYGFA